MNVYSSLREASGADIVEVSLGFFDGLHLGHRKVITGLRPIAELGRSAMLSFQTHPQSILFREQPVSLITGLPHKQKILRDWGVPAAVLLPFDLEISRKSPETFLEELRLGFPRLQSVRVGENFRFGHQRQGSPVLLQKWGKEQGVQIEVVPSLVRAGLPISSSRIRSHLGKRELSEAADLLGRPYSLYGNIVPGEKLGTQLGFPTANLSTEDGQLLPPGVYGGCAGLEDGSLHPAAINIGVRPTVSIQGKTSIEAHLLNYSGNLYGRKMDLQIIGFLREEFRFESPEKLKEQLGRDAGNALDLFLEAFPPNK